MPEGGPIVIEPRTFNKGATMTTKIDELVNRFLRGPCQPTCIPTARPDNPDGQAQTC